MAAQVGIPRALGALYAGPGSMLAADRVGRRDASMEDFFRTGMGKPLHREKPNAVILVALRATSRR